MEVKSFLTVKQFAEKHSMFSENALRWMIFNRGTNQFDAAFRKVGRKVLIDEAAFFDQINNGRMAA